MVLRATGCRGWVRADPTAAVAPDRKRTAVAAGETITLLCSSACTDAAHCHRTLLKQLIEQRAAPTYTAFSAPM